MRWSYYTGLHTKHPGYVLWTEENSVMPICWVNDEYKEFRVNIFLVKPVNLPIRKFDSTRVVCYNQRTNRILVQLLSAMAFL